MRVHRPKTLKEMMDLALLVDERNEVYWKGTKQILNKGQFVTKGPWQNNSHNHTLSIWANTNKSGEGKEIVNARGSMEDKGKSISYKHLPNEEVLERRRKGLCFTCNEKFSPTHVCKNKSLRIMLVEEKGSDSEAE